MRQAHNQSVLGMGQGPAPWNDPNGYLNQGYLNQGNIAGGLENRRNETFSPEGFLNRLLRESRQEQQLRPESVNTKRKRQEDRDNSDEKRVRNGEEK